MGMFAADPRPDKVDLGVGVYRSPEGITPIMAAVKTAERRIWETQQTKSYVGIPGDPAYLDAMREPDPRLTRCRPAVSRPAPPPAGPARCGRFWR
jgi:hypothetical protein